MAAGLGLLRLSPDVFWSMTLRELELAFQGISFSREAPISYEKLEDMMKVFPDKKGDS